MVIRPPARLVNMDDIVPLANARRARKWVEFDLHDVTWVSPVAVVALLAASLGSQERGIAASVKLPHDPQVRSYLYAIGFCAELKQRGWVGSADVDAVLGEEIGLHVPVTSMSTERDVDMAAGRLWEALHAAQIPATYFHWVVDVASELTHNAREHGSQCYVVAQTHTGRRSGTPGIHVAVADFGPGFADTLRKSYGRKPDHEAIVFAFKEGVSGTGASERGFGLSYVLEAIGAAPGAVMHIWSGKGHATCGGGGVSAHAAEPFPGTVASAYFPYDRV